MGTAETQGKLWSKRPQDWATIHEPMHKPMWNVMFDKDFVGSGSRFIDAE